MNKQGAIIMYVLMFIQLLWLISTDDMILKAIWVCLFMITMSIKDAFLGADE